MDASAEDLFRVINAQGKEVQQFRYWGGEASYILPLAHYPVGTYFLQYQATGSLPYTQKFVVLR